MNGLSSHGPAVGSTGVASRSRGTDDNRQSAVCVAAAAARLSGGGGHELAHLGMLGLDIDRNAPARASVSLVVGPIEATTAPATSPRAAASASFNRSAMRSKFTTCWLDVNSTTSISPAAMRPHVRLQRRRVLGQFPVVDLHRADTCAPRASSPATRLALGMPVFLQAHGLLRDRDMLAIDRGQHFAPGVRLAARDASASGPAPRARRPASARGTMVTMSEIAARNRWRSTCRSTSASRCRMPTPVMKITMSICAGHQPVGEIDRLAILARSALRASRG